MKSLIAGVVTGIVLCIVASCVDTAGPLQPTYCTADTFSMVNRTGDSLIPVIYELCVYPSVPRMLP